MKGREGKLYGSTAADLDRALWMAQHRHYHTPPEDHFWFWGESRWLTRRALIADYERRCGAGSWARARRNHTVRAVRARIVEARRRPISPRTLVVTR